MDFNSLDIDKAVSDKDLGEIEQKIPLTADDAQVRADAAQKVQRLRNWLVGQKLDGVLISRRDNFAWATVGGDNHVLRNTEYGSGHLLITG